MADDIVARLRRHRDLGAGERFYMDSYAAADEIERLRKLVVLCPKCYEAEHGVGRWEQEVRGA